MNIEITTRVKEFNGKFFVVEVREDNKGGYEEEEDYEDLDACDSEEEAKELQKDIEIENATCELLDALHNEFRGSRSSLKEAIESALRNL